jgi:hypothetical protein
MEILNKDLVNGLQKAWICEHFLSRQLNWPMTVYDFPLTFAQDLVVVTNHYFKKWTKVCRSADTNIFYRRREHFGLQWTNLAVQHKKCQLIKCHLIKHSSDAVLRETYKIRENRFSKKKSIGGLHPSHSVHLPRRPREIVCACISSSCLLDITAETCWRCSLLDKQTFRVDFPEPKPWRCNHIASCNKRSIVPSQ